MELEVDKTVRDEMKIRKDLTLENQEIKKSLSEYQGKVEAMSCEVAEKKKMIEKLIGNHLVEQTKIANKNKELEQQLNSFKE